MNYLYEFIGTFFLVFTVGMTVLEPNSGGILAPAAIGSVLAVMVYAGGHISGAHYNPAVSLAVYLRKKLSMNDLLFYWGAQLAAAVVAGFLVCYLKGEQAVEAANPAVAPAMLAEFLFTFALCYVVLNVATSKKTAGNSYFGFAIGFTVFAGAVAVGPISGGAFNPAVALGISVMQLSAWSNLWIFLVANLLGGFIAASVVNLADHEEDITT